MKIAMKNNKGFTLIELLVVVSIISLLASIVFASLASARSKAKDVSIKEEVGQFANLLALNYSDYGNYCNLQTGWATANAVCSALFTTGNYASSAQAICSNIYNNATTDLITPAGHFRLYAGTGLGCSTTYSIMVPLNDGKWYCSGSSGIKAEYPWYSDFSDGTTPGCYMNP